MSSSGFLVGMGAPIHGFKLIRQHSSLKKLAFFPVLISFVLLVVGFSLGFSYYSQITALLFGAWISPEGGILSIMLGIMAFFIITVLVLLGSYFFATLLASPFNSILAEKALEKVNINLPLHVGLKSHTIKFFRLLKTSILKAIVFICVGFFVFLGSFIPGLSLVMIYLGLIIFAFDCVDYSLEALEWNLSQRLKFLRQNFTEIAGFALVLGVIFIFPLLNLLLLPIAVCSGSYLVGYIQNAQKRNP